MARLVDEVRDGEDAYASMRSQYSDEDNEKPTVDLPAKREPEDPFDRYDDPDCQEKAPLRT